MSEQVGVRHVRFWTRLRGRLSFKRGTYDVKGGSETMLCVAFTDPDHVSAAKDVVFTGSKDGRVWIWRDTKALWNIQCCKGPVFDLLVREGTVVSGGKDISTPIRDFKIGPGWPTKLELRPSKGAADQGLGLSPAGGKASGGCVRALAWNGSELVVGTAGNALYTLNPRTGVSKLMLQGHAKGSITALACHTTKPLLVSVGDDGTVHVTNWKDRSSTQFRSINEPLTAVAVHDEKGHIAVGLASGELRVLDLTTLADVEGLVRDYGTARCAEHKTQRQGSSVSALSYSPDQRWLALGAGDATIDLYNVSAGYKHIQACDGHKGPVIAIDWSVIREPPSAKGVLYIHSCSLEGRTVMAWEMTPMNTVNPDQGDVQLKPVSAIQVRDEPWHTWTLPLGWPVGGAHDALDDDATVTSVCSTVLSAEQTARKLLAVGDSSGELSLLQFPCVSGRARAVKSALRHRAGVSAMVMTPDRSCLISAGADDQLLLVSLVTPTATAAAATHDAVEKAPMPRVRNLCAFVSLSNNLQSVAAVLADLDVLVWRVQGLKDGAWDVDIMAKLKNDPSATPSVGHTAGINTCRFSADDTRLCTASRDKSLRLWDLQGDETRRFTGHQGDVIAADFSPDGKLVAAGDSNKLLRVWDASGLARQAERAKAEGHRKSILCVAWADDSRRICTGSADKTLRIWAVPDSVSPGGGGGGGGSSSGGAALAAAGEQGPVDLTVACRLRGHSEAVVCCAFSGDSSSSPRQRVCSGGMDKNVIVWDVGTGSEVCRLVLQDCLLGCAFSFCSLFVGAVCLDNSVHVWDVSVDGEPECVDKYTPKSSAAVNVIGCAFTADQTMLIVLARAPNRLAHAATLYLPNARNPSPG